MSYPPEDFQRAMEAVRAVQEVKPEQPPKEYPVEDMKQIIGTLLTAAEYTASVVFQPGIVHPPDETLTLWRTVPRLSGFRRDLRGWWGPDDREFVPRQIGRGVILTEGHPSQVDARGYAETEAQVGIALGDDGVLHRHYGEPARLMRRRDTVTYPDSLVVSLSVIKGEPVLTSADIFTEVPLVNKLYGRLAELALFHPAPGDLRGLR